MAKTLYLFAETLTNEHCQCLGMDGGTPSPDLELKVRSLGDIKSFQEDFAICLVIPQSKCSLHLVNLPWIAPKKARLAIPFALEDNCAQSIHELHFAFDKSFYRDDHYWVLCCEKSLITDYLETLHGEGIFPSRCTSEWFAIEENTVAFNQDYAIFNTDDFKGCLPYETALHILTEENKLIRFQNASLPELKDNLTIEEKEQDFKLYCAENLQSRSYINMLQGAFQQKQRNKGEHIKYWIAGVLGGIWILSIFAVNLWAWFKLHHENHLLSEKIEIVYKEFFPQATQVISPRFRIERLIKGQGSNSNDGFWNVIIGIHNQLKDHPVSINSLTYRNQQVQIALEAESFNDLDSFQDALKQNAFKVKQLNAGNRDGKVVANLEISP